MASYRRLLDQEYSSPAEPIPQTLHVMRDLGRRLIRRDCVEETKDIARLSERTDHYPQKLASQGRCKKVPSKYLAKQWWTFSGLEYRKFFCGIFQRQKHGQTSFKDGADISIDGSQKEEVSVRSEAEDISIAAKDDYCDGGLEGACFNTPDNRNKLPDYTWLSPGESIAVEPWTFDDGTHYGCSNYERVRALSEGWMESYLSGAAASWSYAQRLPLPF